MDTSSHKNRIINDFTFAFITVLYMWCCRIPKNLNSTLTYLRKRGSFNNLPKYFPLMYYVLYVRFACNNHVPYIFLYDEYLMKTLSSRKTIFGSNCINRTFSIVRHGLRSNYNVLHCIFRNVLGYNELYAERNEAI